jgi:hypothetical protein
LVLAVDFGFGLMPLTFVNAVHATFTLPNFVCPLLNSLVPIVAHGESSFRISINAVSVETIQHGMMIWVDEV